MGLREWIVGGDYADVMVGLRKWIVGGDYVGGNG